VRGVRGGRNYNIFKIRDATQMSLICATINSNINRQSFSGCVCCINVQSIAKDYQLHI